MPARVIIRTPPPVTVGQSVNGSTTNSAGNRVSNYANYDFAGLSGPGPNPSTNLDGPLSSNTISLLRFPSDTPPYYMSLAINNYTRSSWAAVGNLTETGRIILPLPQQMIDNHNIRYDIKDLGIAGGAGFNVATGQSSEAAAQATVGAVKSILNGAADKSGLLGAGAKKAFSGSLAAAGIAVNEFMTVMLSGPDYKKRDFVWRFSPKSSEETRSLRRIIQLINNSMAPSLTGLGSAFFSWPKIWAPQFVYGGDPELLALNTFRMKASVITDASFNYTPNGTFSPFASTKAPTSIEMRLSFLELEFWLAGNFDDDPANVSADAAPKGSTSNVYIQNLINGTVLGTNPNNEAVDTPPFNNPAG